MTHIVDFVKFKIDQRKKSIRRKKFVQWRDENIHLRCRYIDEILSHFKYILEIDVDCLMESRSFTIKENIRHLFYPLRDPDNCCYWLCEQVREDTNYFTGSIRYVVDGCWGYTKFFVGTNSEEDMVEIALKCGI